MDALDEYGDQLFGRRIRLRVLLWADEQRDVFNQSEAAKGVEYSSSGEVAKELERLVRLGMLRKFGRSSRVGPQNYLRVDHPGWVIAGAARRAVDAGLQETEAEPNSARVDRARVDRGRVDRGRVDRGRVDRGRVDREGTTRAGVQPIHSRHPD